jgi:Flp pilus assembly pilin Flp
MLKHYLRMRNRLEEGQDLVEYALLLGLIAVVCFVAVQLLGTEISTIFSGLASTIGGWSLP